MELRFVRAGLTLQESPRCESRAGRGGARSRAGFPGGQTLPRRNLWRRAEYVTERRSAVGRLGPFFTGARPLLIQLWVQRSTQDGTSRYSVGDCSVLNLTEIPGLYLTSTAWRFGK